MIELFYTVYLSPEYGFHIIAEDSTQRVLLTCELEEVSLHHPTSDVPSVGHISSMDLCPIYILQDEVHDGVCYDCPIRRRNRM